MDNSNNTYLQEISKLCKSIETHKLEKDNNENKHHYVYNIHDTQTGMNYIGSRSCNRSPEDDLGKDYISSSEKMKTLIRSCNDPSRFLFTILDIRGSMSESRALESTLHEIYQVDTNPNFYNKSKQTPNGYYFDVSGTQPLSEILENQPCTPKGSTYPQRLETGKNFEKSLEKSRKFLTF